MSTEIEAKFAVDGLVTYDAIRALPLLGSFALLDSRQDSVRDKYLDTADRAFLAAGYACRMRELAGSILVTIKSMGAGNGGVHRREEIEAALPPDAQPIPADWPPSPARDKALEIAGPAELQVLFELQQARFVRAVMDGNRRVAEASLDNVSVVSPAGAAQWNELEVELCPDGTENDLAAIGGWIRATLGLNAAVRSKFERALELSGAASPAEPPALRRARRPPAARSASFDGPAGIATDSLFTTLAALGYKARVRRRTNDHVTFYDTHDGAFMAKGFTVAYSRAESTWRVREDGEVAAEEHGPQDALPLEGSVAAVLGSIPTAQPTLPLLEADLERSECSLSSLAAPVLRLRVGQWTFRSVIQPVAPCVMLRVTASGPRTAIEYLSTVLRERQGFLPARASIPARGLSLLGLAAPGAGAPDEFRVQPGDTVAQACRRIFQGEAWRMRMNVQGAVRDLDPEFVHDLRVATRRARSAARLFDFILPPDTLEKLRDELRWIAGLLGSVRDLDVLGARLDAQVRMTASATGFSGMVREHLQSSRQRALGELVPALESERFRQLLLLLDSTGESIPAAAQDLARGPLAAFARRRIDKAFKRLGPWIGLRADSLSDAELHRVRILFKRLRYTCEFFRHLPAMDLGSLIGTFVSYQDCLGLHQDAATAIRLLTDLLGGLAPGGRSEEVLLSMGALLQVQREAQRAQRQKFERRWEAAAELPTMWKRLRESPGAAG